VKDKRFSSQTGAEVSSVELSWRVSGSQALALIVPGTSASLVWREIGSVAYYGANFSRIVFEENRQR